MRKQKEINQDKKEMEQEQPNTGIIEVPIDLALINNKSNYVLAKIDELNLKVDEILKKLS